MSLNITTPNVQLELLDDGRRYIGGLGDLAGLWAVGDTEDEAFAEFVEVIRDAGQLGLLTETITDD